MENSRMTLVGRYPALLEYLQGMLQRSFPSYHVQTGSTLGRPDPIATSDLLVYIQDRDAGIDVAMLTAWQRASGWTRGVLILREESARLVALPEELVVRDLSIDAQALCALIKTLAMNLAILPHRTSTGWHHRPFHLTPKEKQVLGHLSQGIPNKLIARRMDVTEATIKSHMRKLFAKTGCETRTHMALMASRLLEATELQ